MKQKLDRTLGMFSCITISSGTMIGSAIFVLAGTSYEVAGPSSVLSIFLAGIAAMFTALSFAEIVTFIPRAGGGYAYVREATNNGILGFMTGWGFWLGYSMSCGLFALGFGNFLNYFFPFIPQMIGAYLLIAYITITNIKGAKSSGKLQNIITSGLLILLFSYIIYGIFYIDTSNYRPFFTKEIKGMLNAMGFLYITYIGYGLITTASEEVINPEKTIPKAIVISLIIVIFIKTSVFLIACGIINWDKLIPSITKTPMIDTAVKIGGVAGGYLFALAGILATVSSINTAMMASSRTSFAMSRDRRLPGIFKNINKHTKTPIFSILISAVIVIISTSIKNLEKISVITSIFSLVGYSFVNIALIIFRKKLPDIKRNFKVPFYPLIPILGIMINIFLVFQLIFSNILALGIAFFIILLGLLYYYFMLPKLKVASKGISTRIIPEIQHKNIENKKENKIYKVIVPIAHPKTTETLLELGARIARAERGKLIPLHVVNIPEIIPLDSKYNQSKQEMKKYENVIEMIKNFNINCNCEIESIAVVSRDIVHAIKNTALELDCDLLLLGWSRAKFSKKMLGSVAHKIIEKVPKNVGILKKGSNQEIKKILYPYGGGYHSQLTIDIIKKIVFEKDIEVTFLRITDIDTTEKELEEIEEILKKGINKLNINANIKIIKNESIVNAVISESENYDLVILGASSEWGIKNYFMGSIADDILDGIKCSGLIIRGYNSFTHKKNIRNLFHKAKEHLMD